MTILLNGKPLQGNPEREPRALDMQETPSWWGLGLIFGVKPQTGEVIWEHPRLAKHRKLPHLASAPVRATSSQCQKRMSLSQVAGRPGPGPFQEAEAQKEQQRHLSQQPALLTGPP